MKRANVSESKPRRAATPKERVLKRWPKAVCWQSPVRKRWIISTPDWSGKNLSDESWKTPNAAWASAARSL